MGDEKIVKPRSRAAINATAAQKYVRNRGRIGTLEEWLEQAAARAGTDREPTKAKVKSMRAELERRQAECKAYEQGDAA